MKTNTASSFEALNYTSIARVHEAMNSPAKAVEFYRKALGKTNGSTDDAVSEKKNFESWVIRIRSAFYERYVCRF